MQARLYKPDLIVAETVDFIGQVIAAALDVPWINHGFGMELAGPLIQTMNEVADLSYSRHGLKPVPRLAYLDPCPNILQQGDWTAPADRITIRPQAFAQDGVAWSVPSFPGREDRPLILLTLGTVVNNPEALSAMLASILATTDVNVIVTFGSQDQADATDVDRRRVLPVGFVPLDQLFQGVDLVVSAGGAGTVLATLSWGLPLVLLPMIVDQTWNAERAAAAGTAVVVVQPKEVGAAVEMVLTDPAYRAAAAKVSEQIAQMNPPEQVLNLLIERMTLLP